jgi:hypothetical protein
VSFPAPTRQDHERFCRTEGWQPVRDARGRTGIHHVTYEFALVDGRVLRTRVSRPPDRQSYGKSLWAHILRDQLEVDESTFWACVRDGAVPSRGAVEPPSSAIPAEVVALLISKVGLDEREVATLDRDEAVARLQRYWTEGR